MPVVYPLKEWRPAAATAFFGGKDSTIVADASSGKALRLKETNGTVWDHIQKGGLMAFAIIGVGLLALFMIIGKLRVLQRMGVDSSARVSEYLRVVAKGSLEEARQGLSQLKPMTAQVFAVGLEFASQSKSIVEEQIQAVLLGEAEIARDEFVTGEELKRKYGL